MRDEILNIKNQALAQILDAKTVDELESLRIELLGRNGKINALIKKVKGVDPNARREMGILINEFKKTIEDVLQDRKENLTEAHVDKDEWFDLTIPGNQFQIGNLHGLTKTLSEIVDVFSYLGYQIADGPEIESDYYNFEALNIPKNHPARDTQQTLYVDVSGTGYTFGELILRTQTSAMQGRVMERSKPPLRVLVPGMNYRYEQVDASHGFQFGQVEGFVVDRNIHLTDLFGTIEFVLKHLFGDNAKLKFATTNFPFVEPGVDTYLQCTICGGSGCSFCKSTGWSEIMPAGMIHPSVLKMAGIDTTIWGGFAFAIGLSRVANLKYHIHDLRTLTTPDIRILKQF